jgi:hypothetical protein
VSKRIDQASWRFVDRTRDICTLELTTRDEQRGRAKPVVIHNVYNPGQHTENRTSCLPKLKEALSTYENTSQITLGDFNLHHEHWGGEATASMDPESNDLIDIIQEFQLESMLPTGTVTYDENNYQSCIDLCYATINMVDRIITCGVDKEMDHNSDHLPITIRLDMMAREQSPRKVRNWATMDEKKLRTILEGELPRARRPGSKPALDRYTALRKSKSGMDKGMQGGAS